MQNHRNPNYKGITTVSLSTGLPKVYYSHYNRFFHYALSAIETIPLIALATALKLIIFNV